MRKEWGVRVTLIYVYWIIQVFVFGNWAGIETGNLVVKVNWLKFLPTIEIKCLLNERKNIDSQHTIQINTLKRKGYSFSLSLVDRSIESCRHIIVKNYECIEMLTYFG